MSTAVVSTAPAAAPVPARAVRRLLAPALLVVVLAVSASAGLCSLAGFRWFTVETPSMGPAAPVGTLVVTAPVRVETVRVGQVVAFRPPTEPMRTYTHRVVASQDGGLRTRGDINGAADGWVLHQQDLIGRAVVLLPGAGFLLRAVPILLAGNAVVWLATRRMRTPTVRAALRNTGFGAVTALAGFVVHPFVRIQVLATQAAEGGLKASIVSTGLLPVRVTADSGGAVSLADGQVGTMSLPLVPGGYRLHADLDLPPWGWVALVLVCLLPLAASLVVGLPAADGVLEDDLDEEEEAAAAPAVPVAA